MSSSPAPPAAGSNGTGCLQRAAVEQQRVPGPAEQRRGLVHDAGRHPGELVLRPAGDRDQLVARGTSRSASEVSASAVAHSSAAEEDSPAPAWTSESMAIQAPGTRWPAASSAQATPAGEAAQPVTRPGARPSRSTSPTVSPRLLPGAHREPAASPARVPGPRRGDPLAEREWEHEPLVIVGVLAHQVGPPRGQPHAVRLPAEPLPEEPKPPSLRLRSRLGEPPGVGGHGPQVA